MIDLDRSGPLVTALVGRRTRTHTHSARLWNRPPAGAIWRRSNRDPTATPCAAATVWRAGRTAQGLIPAAAPTEPVFVRTCRPARAEWVLRRACERADRGIDGQDKG